MGQTIHVLKQDYSAAAIIDGFEMADEMKGIDDELATMLVDDFAATFLKQLELLEHKCIAVMKDCNHRKDRLTHALIWGH